LHRDVGVVAQGNGAGVPTASVLPFCTVTVRLSSAATLPVPTVDVVGLGAAVSQTVVCPVVVQSACASAPNKAKVVSEPAPSLAVHMPDQLIATSISPVRAT